MKFFQKRGVAIVVLILAIVASSAWGLHKAPVVSTPEGGEKLDPSLSTAAFEQYVRDEANVLSDKAEKAVSLYNANWDKMFGSIMAVVTVQSSDNLENTAYDYADTMQLGSNDAILVIAKHLRRAPCGAEPAVSAERGGAGRGGQRCDVHHDPHHILCPLDHA